MTPKQPKKEDNFDPSIFAKLESSHEILDRPDKFAEYFKKNLKSQALMKDAIAAEIINLMQTNNAVRDEVKKLVLEVQKEDWKTFLKKFGSWIYTVVAFLLGTAVTVIVTKVLGG